MDEQEKQWKQYALECNAKGICEHSGYEFKECILCVCDCGWEFLDDDQIDFEVQELIKYAQAALEYLAVENNNE
jgi:hypothetical protein